MAEIKDMYNNSISLFSGLRCNNSYTSYQRTTSPVQLEVVLERRATLALLA